MSDYKKSSTDRRDTRNAKDGPEAPKPRASKKNTRKWCKGKVGVEHTPVCRDYREVKHSGDLTFGERQVSLYQGWKILMCSECGKELDYYYPMGLNGKVRREPPWVR